MPKRDKDRITLGSGTFFMQEYSDTMPTEETLFVEENRVGYTKGGAALSYKEETYTEKDDLGRVTKTITTDEEAILKGGLLTWNGNTLAMLADRAKVTEAGGKRITKIGGAGNAKGKYYAIGFKHDDPADGYLAVMIKGRNTAGFEIAFANDKGSAIEPEFKAMPHDEAGTLIEIIEEIQEAG